MEMDYAGFIHFVRRAAQLDDAGARRALQAVLETLAERIAPGPARDLAAALPPELAAWVTTAARVEGLDLDEFLRRVAERAEVDVDTAERYAEAVFAALGQALGPDVITDLTADLPADFDRLLPRGRWVEVVQTERFLRRVAERGALDLDDLEPAWWATEAVLETLAERIAGGEVDDLLERLPLELRPPLKRGRRRTGGRAQSLSLDEFVRRVAEREGTDPFTARDHIRAVFLTLREAVGDDEFFDVTVQLPRDYVDTLALA
jgi:uncharacterized protein (DUF2267 family)